MTRIEALRILGLKPDATPDEVKKAYRQLVIAVHPDKNPAPNARHLFQLVQEAYEFIRAAEEHEQRKERAARGYTERAANEAKARAARERAERESRQREERATAEKEARERTEREKRAKEAREKQAEEEIKEWERQRDEAATGLSWALAFWLIPFATLGLGTWAACDFIGFDAGFFSLIPIPISTVILLYKGNAGFKRYQLRKFYRKHPPPTGTAKDRQSASSVTNLGEDFCTFVVLSLFVGYVFYLIGAIVEFEYRGHHEWESLGVVPLAIIAPIALIGSAAFVLYDIVNWLGKNLALRLKRK